MTLGLFGRVRTFMKLRTVQWSVTVDIHESNKDCFVEFGHS